jgi:hypothetical protein
MSHSLFTCVTIVTNSYCVVSNVLIQELLSAYLQHGIPFTGPVQTGVYKLDESSIAETLILSDLFNINELEALELLLTGKNHA